jgi:hypothetical protein
MKMRDEPRIHEDDIVQLQRRVGPWPAGREGFVVAEKGPLKLVEIADEQGATIDFISVQEADLKMTWSRRQALS